MPNYHKYIFIDNFEDFKSFKNIYDKKNNFWVSTSPYVISEIKKRNKNIINLENYINQNQINYLIKFAYLLSDKILSNNQIKSNYINKNEYKTIFYRDLASMIGTYIYKFYALSNFMKKKNSNSKFIFIGNIINKKEINHLLSADDNVIFDIAKNVNNKNFQFIYSDTKKKIKLTFLTIFKQKLLTILNLNIDSFFFRLYKKFFFKISFKNKKKIFLFKEVYNFENNFLKLIKNFNIEFLDFKINQLKFSLNKKKNIKFYKEINFFTKKNIKNKNMLKINFSPLINLILDKHFQILNNFENNIKKIDNEVSKISSKFTKDDLILSNLLERPLSLYFFLKLRKRVKFAFFEHGETSGYQKCWDIRKKSQTTILGDFAFFSTQHGLNTHKNILSKKIIASSIGADRRYFLKKNLIKKMILRLIVGVPLFKKNVVYLADLFRNNSTITPHIGRDLDVFEDTYKIINYLKEHHKKKTIILKQYPTSLYKDDFLINLDGVKTLSIFNWMHIYYIFDEIYFSAIQSSWLYKNQWQKIFLINRSHYPIHMKFIKSKKKINANLNNKLQLYKVEKISNKIDKGCWINLINQ